MNPFGAGGDHALLAGDFGKGFGGGLDSLGQIGDLLAAEAERFQLVGGEQQAAEAGRGGVANRGGCGVGIAQSTDDLCGGFLGRNHLPGVDASVFVFVEAPACAGRAEPAVLIGLVVEIGVDIAIDFDAVLEVTPLIDAIVAIGVKESPQNLAAAILHDPAGDPADRFGLDNAFFDLFGLRHVARW